jgi:DNA-binding MarR family transcriptional regulator
VSATTQRSGDLLTPEELAGWRGMLRVHASLMKQLDTDLAAGHGLSASSYEVLLFLADAPDGRMRMAQLADSVLLSRSGLTRLVDRLERAGLVEREPCPSDQRGFNALITAEGREVFDAARRTHLSGVREHFLSHFSEEDLATMAEFWDRVSPGASSAKAG